MTGRRASGTARRASSARPIRSADRSRVHPGIRLSGEGGHRPRHRAHRTAPSRSRRPSATAATPGCCRRGSARPTSRPAASRRRPRRCACARGRRADGHPRRAGRRAPRPRTDRGSPRGTWSRPRRSLGEALARFDAVGARFEAGVTHLPLAELGPSARGRRGRQSGPSTRRSCSSPRWTPPCTWSGRASLRSGARVGSGRRAE